MKNRNIPAAITLCAGVIASVTCTINRYNLFSTLAIVFCVLLVFYIIGIIIGKIIMKTNNDAANAYIERELKRMDAEEEEAVSEDEVMAEAMTSGEEAATEKVK